MVSVGSFLTESVTLFHWVGWMGRGNGRERHGARRLNGWLEVILFGIGFS
jgi:hypothetical protein